MHLIFIYGKGGVGKLTTANALNQKTGFRVFHNHIAFDASLAVFDMFTSGFCELREFIWINTFKIAAKNNVSGLIFTFTPEKSVSKNFIPEVISLQQQNKGKIDFVNLVCDFPVRQERVANPSRKKWMKGNVPPEKDHAFPITNLCSMVKPSVIINNTNSIADKTAIKIISTLNLYCENVNANEPVEKTH